MADFVFPTPPPGWLQIDDPTYFWPMQGTRPAYPAQSETPSPLPVVVPFVRDTKVGLYTIDFLQAPGMKNHPWDILMVPGRETQRRSFTLVLVDGDEHGVAYYTHELGPQSNGSFMIEGQRIYKADEEIRGVFDAMTSAQALVAGALGLLHPSIPSEQALVTNVLPSLMSSWRARHGSSATGPHFTVGEMRQAASIYDGGLLEEARKFCQENGLEELGELINNSLLPAQTPEVLAILLEQKEQFDLADWVSQNPLEPAHCIVLLACLKANLAPEEWEQVGNLIFPEAQIDPHKTSRAAIPLRRGLARELLKEKI